MSTNSFHDYVDLKSRTNTRQFSDDEEFTTPPKLSNFGSALLSHTEKTSASEILSSHNNDKIANRLEEMDRSSSRSHPPPSMGNLTSGHTSTSSHSTLFGRYLRNNHQTSMTTMNTSDIEINVGNSLDKSFERIRNLRQNMKEDITSKYAERRSKRFLISNRTTKLGPAKRAMTLTNIFDEDVPNSPNQSINARETVELPLEDSHQTNFKETKRNTDYDSIDFGDLNPIQYIKRHNLPTSDLPLISQIYFDKQREENRQAALRKHSSRELLYKSRSSSSSLSSNNLLANKDNSITSNNGSQPRRKVSTGSSSSKSSIEIRRALKENIDTSNNSNFNSPIHKIYKGISRNKDSDSEKREVLRNISINANHADNLLQQENKRLKRSLDDAITNENINSKNLEVFYHRPAPKPPVTKKVEIVEPAKSASLSNNRNIITVNDSQYEKIELLGRGGSSRVYKVKGSGNRVYALKRVSFDAFDDSSIDGFKGEIELLEKLKDQKRVIQLLDYEMGDGLLYLIMECGDHDLSQILNQRSGMPLDFNFVRFYTKEMLLCIKVVHDAGIVHSDLKPANFVLVKGILKIIDFGIANAVPEHTVNIYRETQIGTPNYMAPEALVAMNYTQNSENQHEGNKWKVGRPSDMWSCGCIIYQMIYGKPPYGSFQGQNRLLAIMNPDVKIPFPEHTSNNEKIPKSAIELMKACLYRNPDKRWTVDKVLSSTFLQPFMISGSIMEDLIRNAVRYGSEKPHISQDDLNDVVDTVLRKFADYKI
ncbi:Mps1p [Saccharomyces cerevisiae YJM326]|nr:Mps1p [Saccharomyces cerevisiae YJM326]CAI4323669.1 ABA_G0008620.mRNA.1.CDS.1 [Saccharomyces cerevisiae]CAI6547087.1 ABA_G0008620.mRNA.1.CDS.1 [Saccharomyces cerevisiae]